MIDCLLIGFHEPSFASYVELVGKMGTSDGAYRDLDLAFVRHRKTPRRLLDLLSDVALPDPCGSARPYHNADFLWPVLLALGSYLARRGLTFDYVNLPHLEEGSLRAKLAAGPRTVAITTTVYVSPLPVLELVRAVREHAPHSRIVVGGPYIANQARVLEREELERLLRYLGADVYVIAQEGERTLAELLGALRAGAPLDAIPNLAYEERGAYRTTPAAPENNPIEENLVDYALFSPESLGEMVSVRTARSCPFACAFCGFPTRAGKYTYAGVDLVERELDALHARGVTTISFLDDTFNVPKRRYKDLLRLMIRKRYGFRWNSFYRADEGDEEAIELMRESGCEGVFLGVESGSDRMLALMNKTARRADYLAAIPQLKAAGIVTHANLIVGFPGETPGSVRETEDLLARAQPDFYRAQLWYADPSTPIWKRRLELGIRGSGFSWRHATMTSDEAAGWVDRMLLSVPGSTWLPQSGFEMWSLFYLQRRGFSLEAVRRLVRCFNAAIAEKLLGDADADIDPALLATFTEAARAGHADPEGPDADAVRALSSAAYLEAERWWYGSLGAPSPAEGGGAITDAGRGGARRWITTSSVIDGALLDGAARAFGVSRSAAALAAFGIAVRRATGAAPLRALAGQGSADGDAWGPVRLDDLPPGELGRRVEQHFAAAARHARFARRLLCGWCDRVAGRQGAVGCGAWFAWREPGAGDGWAAPLRDAIDASEGVGLGLEVVAGPTVELRVSGAGERGERVMYRVAAELLATIAGCNDADPPREPAREAVGTFRF
ncbi:PhpK family radical SAM P-methyltransferase [Sorangium sp. So ce590]|uniref:PhpK family radical SAM P-methyltransferase n=1 Tax=Sorangium sp. So ce590 TaxID=3133317 RepID=UPI003F63D797